MKLIKALALVFVSSVSIYSFAQGYESQPEKKTTEAQSCKKDSANLHAMYEISIRRPSNKIETTSLHLWRNDNKVAHQYPDTNITETWTLVRNRFIKPTRYFDAHLRAIEYQPGETIHGKKETDFSYRYQLISDKLISAMRLESKGGEGCNAVEHYSLQNDHGKFKLSWLPHLKLIKSFSVDRNGYRREWKLADVDFGDDTKSFFAKRQDYQSTDYADIGDDHTDPFLTKMVTQGFIEAGASGYYDEHGYSIGETHAH